MCIFVIDKDRMTSGEHEKKSNKRIVSISCEQNEKLKYQNFEKLPPQRYFLENFLLFMASKQICYNITKRRIYFSGTVKKI